MEAGAVGLAAAFAAGVISFVSPCVLPLVPAYVSYVAGQPLGSGRTRPDAAERFAALVLSTFFVLGFSAVFVSLGASASFLGLMMIGMTRAMPWLMRDFRFHPQMGIAMMTGQLSRFGFWLLETFPVLQRIG